jgi:hypothetical protein
MMMYIINILLHGCMEMLPGEEYKKNTERLQPGMVNMISQIKGNPTGIGHIGMILERKTLKGIGKMNTSTAMSEIENHGQITQEIAGNIVPRQM